MSRISFYLDLTVGQGKKLLAKWGGDQIINSFTMHCAKNSETNLFYIRVCYNWIKMAIMISFHYRRGF